MLPPKFLLRDSSESSQSVHVCVIMEKSRLSGVIQPDATSPTDADWLLIAVINEHPTTNVSLAVFLLFSVPTTGHVPHSCPKFLTYTAFY